MDEAVKRGWKVTVLDDLSTGSRENLAGSLESIDFVCGDIRDRALVRTLVKGADLVFHLAAVSAVPRTVEDPHISAEVNDLGTLNVFDAARREGVGRVIFASTAGVYGLNKETPHHEDLPTLPQNPYAAHKLLGEQYGSMFGALYGLNVVSLRFFNVFGPRQNPESPYSGVISIFLERLRQGTRPTVLGDGLQIRDFVYINDAVRAVFLAADVQGIDGKVFNIGTGRAVTVNDLLGILSGLTGRSLVPEKAPERPGDVRRSRADTRRAEHDLGFVAEYTLENGLELTWEWLRSSRNNGRAKT